MRPFIRRLQLAAAKGKAIGAADALAVLKSTTDEIPEILAAATGMRRRYFGGKKFLCSIVNARSGACPEDCRFCAQSARHNTGIQVYDLMEPDKITRAYREAAKLPISHFGVITSGTSVDGSRLKKICRAVRNYERKGLSWCASLGEVPLDFLKELRKAGVKRYHHNLETAESYFPRVCTTHTYADRIATIRSARKAGLEICSGGILGMGETLKQRVEFALTLSRENVDSIPLNFLMPIKGTKFGNLPPMAPLDILRCIAMFRMTNPRAEVKVCAGRTHMRDVQSMIFYAGATGMMVGRLLTVAGRDVAQDLQMLEDLEIEGIQE